MNTDKLKGIHYTWFGLAGLWLLAFIPGVMDATAERGPVFSYGPKPDNSAQTLFFLMFVVYLIGGFILGKINNKHVARFATANVEESETAKGHEFRVTPAGRHLPFWIIGLFGIISLMSGPFMLAGSGLGTFITLIFAAVLAWGGLQPKLWRGPAPHSFTISGDTLTAGGRSVPLSSIEAFSIDTALKGKSDRISNLAGTYSQYEYRQTLILPGENLAMAYGTAAAIQIGSDASKAAGAGIAEVLNLYFWEMQARSYWVEAEGAGQKLRITEGLDAGTARNLVTRLQALVAGPTPAKP
jgi:hypothetical protein